MITKIGNNGSTIKFKRSVYEGIIQQKKGKKNLLLTDFPI